jgi:hypothetical protein
MGFSSTVFIAASLTAASFASAAVIDYGHNIALSSTGATAIMGDAVIATDPGVSRAQGGKAYNINDGSLSTREQTHYGYQDDPSDEDPWHPYDYAGVTWDTAQNNVAAVKVSFAVFSDGGWFATPASNDAANTGTAGADNVSFYPTIQFSTDGGTTWANVTGQDDDYTTTVLPNVPGGYAKLVGPATFTFNAVSGINALRIIGDGFGPSGTDPNGFIGLFEFEAYTQVPEPASLSLLAATGLLLRRRRA